VKSQQSLKLRILDYVFLRFFEMPLQKNVKSHFFGFKKRKKTYSRTMLIIWRFRWSLWMCYKQISKSYLFIFYNHNVCAMQHYVLQYRLYNNTAAQCKNIQNIQLIHRHKIQCQSL